MERGNGCWNCDDKPSFFVCLFVCLRACRSVPGLLVLAVVL